MNKLTPLDILTSSGRYPEREKSIECTAEIRKNAETLCPKINSFLEDLGFDHKPDLSSGFRTSFSNDKTANAGKKSSHLEAKATDITDTKEQKWALLAASREDLLIKHGLYMEHPSKTIGKYSTWLHLTNRAPASGKRVFYP